MQNATDAEKARRRLQDPGNYCRLLGAGLQRMKLSCLATPSGAPQIPASGIFDSKLCIVLCKQNRRRKFRFISVPPLSCSQKQRRRLIVILNRSLHVLLNLTAGGGQYKNSSANRAAGSLFGHVMPLPLHQAARQDDCGVDSLV